MKMLVTTDENKCLNVEFIDQQIRRFGLWVDNIEAGWFYVDKEHNDSEGIIDKETLFLFF